MYENMAAGAVLRGVYRADQDQLEPAIQLDITLRRGEEAPTHLYTASVQTEKRLTLPVE